MDPEPPTAPEFVVEMTDVTLASPSPRRRATVTGLDWRIAAGDFWVVTTTKNAGQRELLFTASGLQTPDSGRVVIFGHDTSDLGQPRWFKERLQLGIVFEQGGRVLGDMTVAENVSLALRYHRNCSLEEVAKETREVLEATELLAYADAMPGGMTASWQQRIALARALATRPRLLFLERPLAHLEWQHRNWWMSFIPSLGAGRIFSGGGPVALVVITDDANPWRGVARQFAVLHRREWRTADSPPELDPAGWMEEPIE